MLLVKFTHQNVWYSPCHTFHSPKSLFSLSCLSAAVMTTIKTKSIHDLIIAGGLESVSTHIG